MHALSSSNGGSGTGSAAGAEAPGTTYTWQGGKAYNVAESGGPRGYAESDSAQCTIASAAVGASYTCTITNDDFNTPPSNLQINVTSPINENGTATVSGSFTDPDAGNAHTVTISWGDGSLNTVLSLAANVFTYSAPHQYLDDNPTGTPSDNYPITVTVADYYGGSTSDSSKTITVNNLAPVVTNVTGPLAPIAKGGSATVVATFTDVGTQDTHTCTFTWNDTPTSTSSAGTVTETNGSGSCTATHTYAAAGVYQVDVSITDDDTGVGTGSSQYVVIYDASGGFVTGGGWITSQAGALVGTTVTGKANFGFVSKYEKGKTIPTGNTEFQFQAGDFNFHSTVYEWLVISGSKAQYRGSGTVNGGGDYGFILTATDGKISGGGGVDKFRIKIWNKTGGGTVYDNAAGPDDINGSPQTALNGGSIVIHK